MQKRKRFGRGMPRADERTEGASTPPPALDPEKTRERTLQRAVKLLAAKPRSVAELRERLLEKEWTNEEAVEAALAKLAEYGYLDDERFAFGFASSRVRQKPIGRQRLARDLQTKQVSRETAEEALNLVYAETPEEELIARAIEKRTRLRGRPSTRAEVKSLFDHLLRLGFSYDLVIRKVRAASAAQVDEDDEAAPDSADDEIVEPRNKGRDG
ncbi:MAG: regulatory protein RecX [Pyrinomonadaceae bacterium]